ncbi:serine hydrolase domain-containing protein [uncultured Sulfitobacter sp.]|uniref:serine hydrolase domain-containing protein n=1 Tax=uncultured Sulfitobacter sp. TaxID=191468 RepID=UPI00261794E7|nr:serine hydrolase domain-containing protein [uncultured Sulfitobacter sp.]
MKSLLIAALWALFVGAATAQPADTAVGLQAAFDRWSQAHQIPTPGLVVMHKGAVVSASRNADTPVEMASLSKAITAVCAASLIDEGLWNAQTTSAEVLGFGHDGITVADLIGHHSGLMPDSTQGLTAMWVTSTVPRKRIVTETALNRRRDGAGTYQYNNENYAVLGEMIEVALGVSYEQACQQRALDPAGVQGARASDVMGGMLPWGGWKMSAREYARFHYHWFGPQGAYAKGAPAALRVDVGGGAQYGLGMFERRVAVHRNFWHFGLWCLPFRLDAGAYAVIWKGEWSAVAVYDKCIDWDAMRALDTALVEVVYDR